MNRIFGIAGLLMVMLLPAQAMALVYEADFVQGQTYPPGTPQGDAWNTFVAEAGAGAANLAFNRVTISGSNDPVGMTCSQPDAVNQIAVALSVYGNSATVDCDGNVWRVGACGGGQDLSINGGICSCAAGYVVRPTIGNSNWGGIDGETCFAADQTIKLEFALDVLEPVPVFSNPALLMLTLLVLMAGLMMTRRLRRQ